ncbi:MAG: endonuclease/exonuclease/phosphatase family protein [Patescibacteria group bacterium]|nr:endonuclease/exonuclease/phosphatase family protein [Patescibacteria group bacterium]
MKLKLLTYNLFFDKAIADARRVMEEEQPDILCVQELLTDYKALTRLEKKPWKLAGWSNSFVNFWNIYGIATYINTEKWRVLGGRDDSLPSSTYDLWIWLTRGMHMSRRYMQIRIQHRKSKHEVVVYNTHLTHLSFADFRLAQLRTIFNDMEKASSRHTPVLICGDFNLYNGKTELEAMLLQYKLKEATTNLAYTFTRHWWFGELKMKLDYILYRNLEVLETRRLPHYSSDHHPVVSEFKLGS